MSSDLRHTLEAAGLDPDSLGPFAPVVEALCAVVAAGGTGAPRSADVQLAAPSAFEPWRAYTAKEAAEFLGLARTDSVYEIPEVELPRVRVGPNRGSVRFLGADLVCYAKALAPIDYEAVRDQFEDRLKRPAPAAMTLPGRPGRKRIV